MRSRSRHAMRIGVRGDRLFYLVTESFLMVAMILVLYPLVYIVSASLSSSSAVVSGRVWLYPVDFSLKGYEAVISHPHIMVGYVNSIYYAVLGTMFNLVLTLAAAYPLARRDFSVRNVYMVVFMITMFFNGGLIPTYMLVANLGLVNTRTVMIVANGISVYNVVITRTYIQSTISRDLLDAAQIDGMNDVGILLRIVLPLSKAIIAVMALFYAVGHWNQFFNALLYLHDRRLFPLQLVLREILVLHTLDMAMMEAIPLEELVARESLAELLKYAVIVVATLPVMCIYPWVQKYFVQGVMLGSLKG